MSEKNPQSKNLKSSLEKKKDTSAPTAAPEPTEIDWAKVCEEEQEELKRLNPDTWWPEGWYRW